jgi:peptide/nickel transport system substrate-binding protein
VGADPDLFAFWHSSQVDYPGLNLAQFSDRDADKLLEDARKTTDEAERNNLYKKFQDILITELPAIFLYSPNYDYIINNQVKGVNMPRIVSPADRFNSLPDWYLKTKWVWR